MATEYIDATPTWSALLPAMLDLIRSQDPDSKNYQTVVAEFKRMAQAADAFNQLVKDQK